MWLGVVLKVLVYFFYGSYKQVLDAGINIPAKDVNKKSRPGQENFH